MDGEGPAGGVALSSAWLTRMRIERVVPILTVADLEATAAHHEVVLGMQRVMDHGWIVTLADGAGHQLSLMTKDATAPVNPVLSVFVDDVQEAHDRAVEAGLVIVHPLTDETWGVTRFFYRAPDGQVVNVGMHTP